MTQIDDTADALQSRIDALRAADCAPLESRFPEVRETYARDLYALLSPVWDVLTDPSFPNSRRGPQMRQLRPIRRLLLEIL